MANIVVVWLVACGIFPALAQSPITLRYFYDDAGQLFRVLDPSGTLLEYTYDATGNITNIARSTIPPSTTAIFNITPLVTGPGQIITIQGQNFSGIAASNIISVNGINATVLSASGTSLTVQLGAGTTAGTVMLSVNGVAVSSGELQISTPLPYVNSVTPNVGVSGTPIVITLQGQNLNAATFSLSGGGVVNSVVSATATQAVIKVTPGAPGPQAVLASNSFGMSAASLTPQNVFTVLYSSRGEADSLVVMVLNSAPSTATSPSSGVISEADSAIVMVLNAAPSGGTSPSGGVFSEADSLLVALSNGASGTASRSPAPALISSSRTEPRKPGSVPSRPVRTEAGLATREAIAGETILLVAPEVENAASYAFQINGIPLDTNHSGQTLFTVPGSLRVMTLTAAALDAAGEIIASNRLDLQVVPRAARPVSGKVVDSNGQPVSNVRVRAIPAGLATESFHFDHALTGIPDLTGLKPSQSGFVTAVNLVNPRGVFGTDPYATRLTPDSVTRLTGNLWAPETGQYQLRLTTHVGASLRIDGERVLAVAAPHDVSSTADTSIQLQAGWHTIELVHFETVLFPELQLKWARPGRELEVIASEFLDAGTGATSDPSREDGAFNFTVASEWKRYRIEIVAGSRIFPAQLVEETGGIVQVIVDLKEK